MPAVKRTILSALFLEAVVFRSKLQTPQNPIHPKIGIMSFPEMTRPSKSDIKKIVNRRCEKRQKWTKLLENWRGKLVWRTTFAWRFFLICTEVFEKVRTLSRLVSLSTNGVFWFTNSIFGLARIVIRKWLDNGTFWGSHFEYPTSQSHNSLLRTPNHTNSVKLKSIHYKLSNNIKFDQFRHEEGLHQLSKTL